MFYEISYCQNKKKRAIPADSSFIVRQNLLCRHTPINL